jgi:hypothetical protein
MQNLKVWAAALAGIAGLAAGRASAEDHLWAKIGATDVGATADLAGCEAQSKTTQYHVPVMQNYTGGLVGALIAAGGTAIREDEAKHTFLLHCMRRHGYVWLPLTRDESRALGAAASPDVRRQWIDRLYAGDLAKRLDSAWAPVVPPLPDGQEEPLTFDGLRLDPATLTPASGVVTKGGAVLSGRVTHAATARLATAVDIPVIPDLTAPAGTVFYQVVTPTDFDPEEMFWCGPLTDANPNGMRTITYCIDVDDRGYAIHVASLESWYAPPPVLGLGGGAMRNKTAKLLLKPSEADLLGPFQLSLVLTGEDKSSVSIGVDVAQQKRHQRIWEFTLPLAANGTAVLPFWTHKLTLTRTDKGVNVAFTADGDGKGWMEAETPL